jgi:hypothetical protein
MVPLDAGMVSLGAGTVPLGAGMVPLGAGMVPLDAGMVVFVQFVNGMVPLDAGMVPLDAGMVVFVQFVNGMVPLVAGMVELFEGMVSLAVVLQGNRYTGIVNMISEYLWVWLVEVMLEEVLLAPAGLEAFCIVLLEEVTLALLQLVPLMVSLVVPSGAGTVLFEVTVVMFTNVLFSEIVLGEGAGLVPFVVSVTETVLFAQSSAFGEDTFEEDTFGEDTFEEDTFQEDIGEGTSEHGRVSFTMRAREGSHNVALYSLPIKALR